MFKSTYHTSLSSTGTLPLIALRDTVILPRTIMYISVNRPKSIAALRISHPLVMRSAEQEPSNHYVLITTQKKENINNPQPKDLFDIGVVAEVKNMTHLLNNQVHVLIDGVHKVKISNIRGTDSLLADYEVMPEIEINNSLEFNQVEEEISELFIKYIELTNKIDKEVLNLLDDTHFAWAKIEMMASHMPLPVKIKQDLLMETSQHEFVTKFRNALIAAIAEAETEQRLIKKVKKQIEKTQRNFFLNEQLKAIQQEIDGGDPEKSELAALEAKIKKLNLSQEAREKAENEMKKLRSMNSISSEASLVRNYLDTLLALPWGKKTSVDIDVTKTEEILDRDHYGLKKVKERIVEYISILKRSSKVKGPILCLIGPPGVGKTSLVKSIAESMQREYAKISLGGVRDEAEIRGHRRTYLGSMPGRLIAALKKAKSDNPVMLLDEIDKMTSDFRGDPAAALLEVLDPEQNKHFVDHYIEVEYDLSDVVFIATANSYNLPRPLLDRLEIINVSGYIEEEKLQIARDYLLPKQLVAHNMDSKEFSITNEAILDIIRYYTKEAGVRSLDREIGAIARKALTKILKNPKIKSVKIDVKDLEEYLGVKKYRFGLAEEQDQIGVTTGLAYTEVGGDLISIEAVHFRGKGGIKATGKLGEVMKESTEAAYSCFLSKAESLGLKENDYKEQDIHLHVPEGATPKDGPSAGIAIYTTIVSLMTKKPVNKNVAMTGEVTLHGKVLPIGGLREKLLAAKRGNITTVLIPQENVKDLQEIPDNVKNNLSIIPVSNVEQVLQNALVS